MIYIQYNLITIYSAIELREPTFQNKTYDFTLSNSLFLLFSFVPLYLSIRLSLSLYISPYPSPSPPLSLSLSLSLSYSLCLSLSLTPSLFASPSSLHISLFLPPSLTHLLKQITYLSSIVNNLFPNFVLTSTHNYIKSNVEESIQLSL